STEDPRNTEADERCSILRAPGRIDAVTGPAPRALGEGSVGLTVVRPPSQQQGEARGHRCHQFPIVMVVRLFRSLRAEHEHCFALMGSARDYRRNQINRSGWNRRLEARGVKWFP